MFKRNLKLVLTTLVVTMPTANGWECTCFGQSLADEAKAIKVEDPTGGLTVDATEVQEEHRVIFIRPKLAKPVSTPRLFPGRSERRPGNAAPIFLRQNFEATSAIEKRKEFEKNDASARKLSDPNVLLVESLGLYRLADLERAAYRETAVWEYPLYEPEFEQGGIRTLLPDVQETRGCSRYLCAMTRAAIAKGDVASAERYIRMGLALSQHVSQTPFFVVKLVASSQVRSYQLVIEELIQMPAASNYYWDLASLPRPMLEVRDALQWEWNVWSHMHPELRDLDKVKSPEKWRELHDAVLVDLLELRDGRVPNRGTPELEKLKSEWVSKSRELLPRLSSFDASAVKSMSDAEVCVRYWWLRVEQVQNLLFPAALLEAQDAIPLMAEREKQVAELLQGEEIIRDAILPVINAWQFRHMHMRDQKFCLLRTIEAIRHWSAEHGGKLPEQLSELTLPAPQDPLSGKPFEYQRAADGKSAELRGRSFQLEKDQVKSGFTYQLQLVETK